MSNSVSRLEAIKKLRNHVKKNWCERLHLGPNENYSIFKDDETGKLMFHRHELIDDGEEYQEVELREIKAAEVLQLIRRWFDRFPLVYINAYAVSRHYGGREEGGWYYDAGEALASVPVLKKPGRVEQIKELLTESLGPQYKRNHTRHSVLGGEDLVICTEDETARDFPEARPRYE